MYALYRLKAIFNDMFSNFTHEMKFQKVDIVCWEMLTLFLVWEHFRCGVFELGKVYKIPFSCTGKCVLSS